MKRIEVVAAIIVHDGKILATQRGYGNYKGSWEFPGGKIEPGEAPEAALVREIHEELDADIKVGPKLITVDYDYPEFAMTMQCLSRARQQHEATRAQRCALAESRRVR